MPLINLTPHTLNVHVGDGKIINIEPSGKVARVSTVEESGLGFVDGIPISKSTFGQVVDLPPSREGTFFIVSRILLSACPDRQDLLAPGTLVRNEKGQPIGCQGLSR